MFSFQKLESNNMAQPLLTNPQVKKLGEYNWDNIKPFGASFVFYQNDFRKDFIWEELCERFDLPNEAEHIKILVVATTIQ
jgi:hypothetical protein